MTAQTMQIHDPLATDVVDEADVYTALLPLDGARVIELGCGAAAHTRAIAGTGRPASVLACEVDAIQHRKNLEADDVPATVTFARAGAEAIPAADNSADVVMMFKSLHHVPVAAMDAAMAEIARVLRPGGLAYISEPVFAGDFNEVLRMFHDESEVRRKAFEAVQRAVDGGVLELAGQRFFHTRNDFDDFADFENRVLAVTHTQHELSPELYEQVRKTFEGYMGPEGARFTMPIRVDLLRSPQ
jgi:ubiquinone/menaquinone biosynthesis C-methylase UbiE